MQTYFPEIISNTDLALWSECELKWFRSRCQHLRKFERNIDLTAGGVFAAGLELVRTNYYFQNIPLDISIETGKDYIMDTLSDFDYEEDTAPLKSPKRISMALERYFDEYPLDTDSAIPVNLDDGTKGIEHRLTTKLDILHPKTNKPLIFKGKLDLLVTYMNRLALIDEKTCKSFNENQQELLNAGGQFIGYAYLGRENGLDIKTALIRKVAIQKTQIKLKQFEIAITDFMLDTWQRSMHQKVTAMVTKYNTLKIIPDFKQIFIPDFQLGCTSYFKPCPFMDGCTSKHGEKLIESEFEQLIWNSETRKEVPLELYLKDK